MTAGEKFREMADLSKCAIEDFNDFAEDRAIAWADDEIRRYALALARIAALDCVYGVGCVVDDKCECPACIAADCLDGVVAK